MSATPSSIKAMLPWVALALIVFAIDFCMRIKFFALLPPTYLVTRNMATTAAKTTNAIQMLR